MKEIGHLGVYGVHAQLHVIQVKDPGPEVTQVVNPVLAAQQLLEIASVSGLIFSPTAIMVILVLKLFVSVEGTWNAWGAFSTCSKTCGTGSQSQTRGYTGNRPCLSSDTNTQSCVGKMMIKSTIIYITLDHISKTMRLYTLISYLLLHFASRGSLVILGSMGYMLYFV